MIIKATIALDGGVVEMKRQECSSILRVNSGEQTDIKTLSETHEALRNPLYPWKVTVSCAECGEQMVPTRTLIWALCVLSA